MIDSGFMPLLSEVGLTETIKTKDVLLPLGRKQRCDFLASGESWQVGAVKPLPRVRLSKDHLWRQDKFTQPISAPAPITTS